MQAIIALLIASIVSGFGYAIGYGLAVALFRQIPSLAQRLKDGVAAPTMLSVRRQFSWPIIWRLCLAAAFVIATAGVGAIGIIVGLVRYRMRQRHEQRELGRLTSSGTP